MNEVITKIRAEFNDTSDFIGGAGSYNVVSCRDDYIVVVQTRTKRKFKISVEEIDAD